MAIKISGTTGIDMGNTPYGGAANYGASDGLSTLNVNNTSSNSDTNIGTARCYIKQRPYLLIMVGF